jgi:hypothetical protein
MTPGRRRAIGAIALIGWAVATLGGVAALLIRALDPAPIVDNTFGMSPPGLVAFVVFGISWATVGALLMIRVADNLVGAIMTLIGAGYSLSILAAAVTFSASADGNTTVAQAAAWWTVLLSSTGGLALYLAFIFPTGRGHTPAWDRIGRVMLAVLALVFVLLLIQPGRLHLFPTIDNPITGGPDLRPLLGPVPFRAMVAASVLAVPVVVAAVVSRYRAADAIQRLQLKWAFAALSVSLLALLVTSVIGIGGARSEVPLVVYAATASLVPVAIGIAILKRHLYQIDRLISRSLSWAIISAVLLAVFAAGVIALQAALAGVTQSATLAVAGSTLATFALFQPLRKRVQRLVDQRFDRARFDAELTSAEFADRMRGQVDIDAVETVLLDTIDVSIRPAARAVWLRGSAP